MSERVNVGFCAPGSVWIEVDDPEDVEEVVEAFVKKIEQMDDMSVSELIETDPGWLTENLMYVDGEDGEVYQDW